MAPDPDRREARRFEPPPWEQEPGGPVEDGPVAEKDPPEQEATAAAASGKEEAEASGPAKVPDNIDLMLGALKAEEPEALQDAWKVAAAAAVVVTTLGLMLVVWGAVAMARAGTAGAAGLMGSAIMSVMGALFAALGAWLGVRSLRQRGVL